jgi:hypothetical protein
MQQSVTCTAPRAGLCVRSAERMCGLQAHCFAEGGSTWVATKPWEAVVGGPAGRYACQESDLPQVRLLHVAAARSM